MFFILALLAAGTLAAREADLVLENARIYTLSGAAAPATALAALDGKIAALNAEALALRGPKTRRIDAAGRTIVPGLIDSHAHLAGLGDLLENVDLREARSIDAVLDRVRRAAASRKPGEWIRGRAWDQTHWGGAFPTAAMLDRATAQHPVYLVRVDGHAAWANTPAMKLAGLTVETADPPGGKIIREGAGAPTGILIDRAQRLVSSKIPARTPEETERALARAARDCARLGLTSIHDAGIGRAELDAYRRLLAKGELPVRVYAMIGGPGDLWREYLTRGPEIGDALTVRAVKLVADGAMGSRGAAFWQPYSDDKQNSGLLITSQQEIAAVARQAVRAGMQVATHAIGDRANRTVLDAYAEVLGGQNDRRFRVEHAQVISLPDFALFAKYSVIASIQSTHATSDMRWALDRLGPDRMAGAWASRRFLQAGIALANGSDFPVEDANPLLGFYAAVTRTDPAGQPSGGFQPGQKLTRDEALRSFTAGGAFAAFEEKRKGSLAPGMLADFVMLSHDLMTVPESELLQTKVVLTVLGGKIVYQANP